MVGDEGGLKLVAIFKNGVGKVDQSMHFESSVGVVRMKGGGEFKSTHGAGAEVAKSFDGIERGCLSSLSGEPLIDEKVAKLVGKTIGEKTGKALEGGFRKVGKAKGSCLKGEVDGGDSDATTEEAGVVFKEAEAACLVPRDGGDWGVVKSDEGRCHWGLLVTPGPGRRIGFWFPGLGSMPAGGLENLVGLVEFSWADWRRFEKSAEKVVSPESPDEADESAESAPLSIFDRGDRAP